MDARCKVNDAVGRAALRPRLLKPCEIRASVDPFTHTSQVGCALPHKCGHFVTFAYERAAQRAPNQPIRSCHQYAAHNHFHPNRL